MWRLLDVLACCESVIRRGYAKFTLLLCPCLRSAPALRLNSHHITHSLQCLCQIKMNHRYRDEQKHFASGFRASDQVWHLSCPQHMVHCTTAFHNWSKSTNQIINKIKQTSRTNSLEEMQRKILINFFTSKTIKKKPIVKVITLMLESENTM